LHVPDYFRNKAADRPKKGWGTIGTKTILGEMAALTISVRHWSSMLKVYLFSF